MKTKLLILFFIFSVLSVAAVFYLKNYYSYSTTTANKIEEDKTSLEQVVDLIQKNSDKFKGYEGAAITHERSELIRDTSKTEKLIIHFWASWCDPCVNEIPELLTYLKRHSEAIEAGSLKVVIVSVDSELLAIEKFLKSFPELNSKKYLQLWDPEGFMQASFNVDRLPASIILHKKPIDDSGKVIERYMAVVDWRRMP